MSAHLYLLTDFSNLTVSNLHLLSFTSSFTVDLLAHARKVCKSACIAALHE